MSAQNDNTEIVATEVTNPENDSVCNWKPEDEYNLTKEEKKILYTRQKDIIKLFSIVYIFAVIMVISKFIAFASFGISISINIEFLAKVMNASIVLIGLSEGVRSIGKTVISPSGENIPVPPYKLRYLFLYLIYFVFITILCTGFEFACKFMEHYEKLSSFEYESLPDFASNTFLSALASNMISYLVARFGSKITESVDLTFLPIFKKS